MAIKTYTEQLEEVQAAITAILTGAQRFQINGRDVTRANLDELRSWETELRRKVSRQARGGIRTVQVVPK